MAELFRVETVESIQLIELFLPDSIDPLEFDQLNTHMLAHLEGKAGQRWILDLSRASYMGSATLGLIVNVRQRVKSSGGRLVLCGLSRQLAEIFRASSIERLFTIVKTRPEALKALGT